MLKKKFLSFLTLILLLLTFNLSALAEVSALTQESITITTYFPSPYGSYRELRAQRMAVGDNYLNAGSYCWTGSCTNTIDANADLVVEGEVGIGTTAPRYKLEVHNGIIGLSKSGINDFFLYDTKSDESDYDEEAVLSFGSSGDNRSSIFIGPNSNSGGVGRVEFDAKTFFFDHGSVGIRTITPLAPLSVKGTAFRTAYNAYTGLHLDSSGVTAGSGNFGVGIEWTRLGAAANTKHAAIAPVQTSSDPDLLGLAFFVASSTTNTAPAMEALRIMPGTGKVGIGTATPGAKLDIQHPVISGGDSFGSNILFRIRGSGGVDSGSTWFQYGPQAAPLLVMSDYDDPSRIQFQKTGTGTEINPQFSSWIGMGTSSDNNIVIMGDKVGIGTTAPKCALDVKGFTRVYGQILLQDGLNNAVFVAPNNGNLGFVFRTTKNFTTYMAGGAGTGGYVDRLVITPNGNVGIGISGPGSYKLYVKGTAYATGGWHSPSDIRYKKNLNDIDNALEKVLKIRGVSFEWKTDEYKNKGFPADRHYGVVAQEIEKILPEVVKEGSDGEKTVSYTELVPVLIEAIKAQQQEIQVLKQEMVRLKGDL